MGGKIFTAINSNGLTKDKIANNLTTTTTGYVLDAYQGKILNDNYNKAIVNLINNTSANGGINNSLLVDLNNPYADINRPHIIESTCINTPQYLAWGYRTVAFINTNQVIVTIHGIRTDGSGDVWVNAYLGGSGWFGWRSMNQNGYIGAGEVITLAQVNCAACFTGGTDVMFSIPMARDLRGINSIAVSNEKVYIRGNGAAITTFENNLSTALYSLTWSNNIINIILRFGSAVTTNNTALNVQIERMTLSFK